MSEVEITRNSDVLTIELSRPEKANSLTSSVVETLITALTSDAVKDIRLVILNGKGKNFCAGFDLGNIETTSDAELLHRMVRIETLLQAIYHLPFPTLVFAHGRVIGAGSDIVCACTRRIAAPDTTFRMPGLRFGVALGAGRLAQRIGTDAARNLLMESDYFDTTRALRLGFINDVIAVDEWAAVKEQFRKQALVLPAQSTAELISLTCPDTRAEDMAALVRTAGRPGLQRRIVEYKRTIGLGQKNAAGKLAEYR